MKIKVFWFAIVLLTSTLGFSQSFEVDSFFMDTQKDGIIKGIVLDNEANNEPLLLANVTIKNTSITTSTNLDGSFLLNVKPGTYTIVYSFIGYKTIEVKDVVVTSNKTNVNNQTLAALNVSFDISSIN